MQSLCGIQIGERYLLENERVAEVIGFSPGFFQGICVDLKYTFAREGYLIGHAIRMYPQELKKRGRLQLKEQCHE